MVETSLNETILSGNTTKNNTQPYPLDATESNNTYGKQKDTEQMNKSSMRHLSSLTSSKKITSKNRTKVVERTFSTLQSKLDRDAVLTVADLEEILKRNKFVTKTELDYQLSTSSNNNISSGRGSNDSTSKIEKGVAFPQPSIITVKDITVGTCLFTGFIGFFLGVSVSPSLWLLGIVIGVFYGKKIATQDEGNASMIPFSEISLKIGNKIAQLYLSVRDAFEGIWFMYKTGQLSYEYYKTYSMLDQKVSDQ